jgi:GNAT superfamily N-acetyltransferase
VIVSESLEIRPFRPEDAHEWVALMRSLEPAIVQTPRGFLHRLETVPRRAHAAEWVAERRGTIVGAANARLAWWTERADLAWLWVGVRPDARGRAIGTRLYALAEEHLLGHGARKLETWTTEDEAGKRFVASRGFAPTRTARMWSVDPRRVDLADLPRLEHEHGREERSAVPLRAVRERERDLHTLFAEAAADEPADEPERVRFEEWRRTLLASPDLSLDGSVVVMHDDRPVSLAWLGVDVEGGRASHWFTGTLRAYRRRGLARLAKLVAIRWAAENGIAVLHTGNDSTNADMLALNEHLGYRPTATGTTHAKTFE